VTRDLSFVVTDSYRFSDLRKLIDQVKLPDLQHVQFVGCYRGKPLESGRKSLTISLEFRSPVDTLTGESVDTAVRQLVDAASRAGLALRS
jgi:phenylalanyl-tRNA synthetase beta chain